MSEDLIVHVLKTFNETHPAMIIAKCFQAGINPPANFSTCSARELPSFFCLCVGGEGAAIFLLSVCRWRGSCHLSSVCVSVARELPSFFCLCVGGEGAAIFFLSVCRWRVSMRPYLLSLSTGYGSCDCHLVCHLPSSFSVSEIRFPYILHTICLFLHLSVCELLLIFIHFLYASCRLYNFSVCELRTSRFFGMRGTVFVLGV